MMTNELRILTLRMMASATKGAHVRKFLDETALVIEAMSSVYLRLYMTALETAAKSNGEDPAINLLVTELRKQRGEIPYDPSEVRFVSPRDPPAPPAPPAPPKK